eukprot:gene10539-12190_t
MPLVSPPS